MPAPNRVECSHSALQVEVSPAAAEAGFTRPSLGARKAAATPQGRANAAVQQHEIDDFTFPAPLVLPDDILYLDPNDEEPQSLLSWIREKYRNPITARRKTIYVAAVPIITDEVSFMNAWTVPANMSPGKSKGKAQTEATPIPSPTIPDTIAYLTAFYHPLPVKQLPLPTSFLNLNDILDAAMAVLPKDAHSLVMMFDHDAYEDEDDDFCCGRAYGGSRVAMVSSARYHPALDEGVDYAHMWPGSHWGRKRKQRGDGEDGGSGDVVVAGGGEETPLGAAVRAASKSGPPLTQDLYGLWFSRVARTISHELGHCFCLAHCSQPPYLCPVCLAKVVRAIKDVERGGGEDEIAARRYAALAEFCKGWEQVAMFAGYRAWLEKRMEILGQQGLEAGGGVFDGEEGTREKPIEL
ncbi:hypothetical protein B0T17DRAFT_535575 [Bombardia bombarda]|uniref:Archaemetzincin-2 n=1 Tax=Bombardia bombarda TaxID=252184 RepID=A0AA40C1J7_9PEZI|nr:hypothetical protein B0T17DRAFT_535575 [Bombardia bombarda]